MFGGQPSHLFHHWDACEVLARVSSDCQQIAAVLEGSRDVLLHSVPCAALHAQLRVGIRSKCNDDDTKMTSDNILMIK